MKNSNYTVRVIEAESGYKLTQADENVAIKDRFVATKIFLSKDDSEDNYKEITDAEAEEIRKEREAFEQAERERLEAERNAEKGAQ